MPPAGADALLVAQGATETLREAVARAVVPPLRLPLCGALPVLLALAVAQPLPESRAAEGVPARAPPADAETLREGSGDTLALRDSAAERDTGALRVGVTLLRGVWLVEGGAVEEPDAL